MRITGRIAFAALLLLTVGWTAQADSIKDAIVDGELELDLRYRYEWVEQEGFDKTANANTIRLRVGWITGLWHGLYAAAVFDGNWSIGSERYNSTSNGLTQYPVVADPQDTQLNQGYLAYKGPLEINALLGRQTINLDNQRFVGSVAFRQLEQRFDNFRFNIRPAKNLKLDYMYANRVYRIFGEHNPNVNLAEQDIEAHFFNVGWDLKPIKLTGYYYATEFESDGSPFEDQQNLGIRVTGKPKLSDSVSLPFVAEYARQTDYGDRMGDFDADYGFAELGVALKPVTFKLGYELLGSDGGTASFQTPFATLHKFNGWADVFLTTPITGLQDVYAAVVGNVAKVGLMAIYHDFTSDVGSIDYGTEWGLRAWRKFDIYHVELKYADYSSDFAINRVPSDPQFVGDKKVFWFTLGLAL